ncbi:MAG: hypothetical protein IKZ38_03500 [Clostridia bacterium]|nr:hypothetical protein [Clostridia bacterium]
MENQVRIKKMLGLKIVVIVLFAIATAFVVSFVPSIVKNLNGTNADRFGAAIGLIIMLIYGSLSYLPAFLTALVGTIVSGVRRSKGITDKKTFIFFIISLVVIVLFVIGVYLFAKLIT